MNVGDYVRTNLKNEIVIRKVIDIIHSASMNDNRMVFDKPTKFTYYVEDNENYKSSPQIIDLIEVGDYVNGNLVYFVGTDSIEVFWYKDEKQWLDKENINTIVTHEQMEAMQYRVEE